MYAITVFIMQVLSDSVAEALFLTGGSAAFETAYFIKKVDKFFDCFNVRSYNEGRRKRKPFQQPYRSEKDFRLNVHDYISLKPCSYCGACTYTLPCSI